MISAAIFSAMLENMFLLLYEEALINNQLSKPRKVTPIKINNFILQSPKR